MIDGIWNVFASRIRFEIDEVPIITSIAGTRPPPRRLHSTWLMTPLSPSASIVRICCCRSAGNWLMMRSIVAGADEVCSVPNTRCPVSAVSTAIATVSRSRISPTSTTSGSSRRAARSASLNESVCGPTSRWLIRQPLFSWMNSRGSSMVMM